MSGKTITKKFELTELLDWLDSNLPNPGAWAHNYDLTIEFFKAKGIQNTETALQWLRENGGYCDCEVQEYRLFK